MNNMETLRVSVVIPAYNEEKSLPVCLDSLINLDYPKNCIEIILVDNGSIDQTRKIAKNYGVRVYCDKSKNVSGLRNLGVLRSSGEIIAFVDADCVVSRDWLKNASIYFKDPGVVAWGSPPVIPEGATWVQRTWFLIRKKEREIQDVEWLETMNLFVRKEQFNLVGGFNEILVSCEDADLCFRLKRLGRIVCDRNISVTHLGEADSVKKFLKKEIWRGHGNLRGIRSHGFRAKELPSLSVPFYFGIFVPLTLGVGVIKLSPILLSLGILFYFLPSLMVLLRARRKLSSISDVLKLLLLLQVYFFSRVIAVSYNFRKHD